MIGVNKMMNFGLEKEMFVTDSLGKLVLPCLGLPTDHNPILAEARGDPANNIIDAVFLLEAQVYRMHKIAERAKQKLSDEPISKINNNLRDKIHRDSRLRKAADVSENLYGHMRHKNKDNEVTAGVHLSVTNKRTYVINAKENQLGTFNAPWDFAKFVLFMDTLFAVEILKAKRNPGFYEIKPDGRIEYRSLPANVNLYKVIDAVECFDFR